MNAAQQTSESETQVKPKYFRFDIFRGAADSSGKVHRIRSVGSAHHAEGRNTYSVHLHTYLKDESFLLPEKKKLTSADYIILTREPSRNPSRKFFWRPVGEGKILADENAGLMQLEWDLIGREDIFMSLYPYNPTGE